jgi:hypothetical protein
MESRLVAVSLIGKMNEKTGTAECVPVRDAGGTALNFSTGMTVAEAVKLYSSRVDEKSSSALRQAVNIAIDNKIRMDFSNDSYADALVLTEIMFQRTSHRLCVFTGDAEGGFFGILLKYLDAALQKIQCNNGSARFIVLSKDIPQCLTGLILKFPKTLQVMRASSKGGVVHHFIAADSTMARVEEPHKPLTQESKADEIKAKVYYNEPNIAEYFEKQFEDIWRIVKEFPINKV